MAPAAAQTTSRITATSEKRPAVVTARESLLDATSERLGCSDAVLK